MVVVGSYTIPIEVSTLLTPTDFGMTEIPNFNWYFDVSIIGDMTKSIQLNSITTNYEPMGLYNAVLLDLKRAVEAEFPGFNIEVAGNTVPKRDEDQPYIYIVPLNIVTTFNPIGHEVAIGHGEGQSWNFRYLYEWGERSRNDSYNQ